MLADLDDVPWSTLAHAYGSAADVPAMFRDLVDGDDDDRRLDGYCRIISTLWHQGSIYSATAYAIPYLVEVFAAAHRSRLRAGSALGWIALAAHDDGNPAELRDAVLAEIARCRAALVAARPRGGPALWLWQTLVELIDEPGARPLAEWREELEHVACEDDELEPPQRVAAPTTDPDWDAYVARCDLDWESGPTPSTNRRK